MIPIIGWGFCEAGVDVHNPFLATKIITKPAMDAITANNITGRWI